MRSSQKLIVDNLSSNVPHVPFVPRVPYVPFKKTKTESKSTTSPLRRFPSL
jgi:hypothetical protein